MKASEMSAGREMDELVHERVVGQCAHRFLFDAKTYTPDGDWAPYLCEKCGARQGGSLHKGGEWDCPRYSEHMGMAWHAAGLLLDHPYVKVKLEESHYHGAYASVVAPDPLQRAEGCPAVHCASRVFGVEAAEALCRALLVACGALEAG